MSTEDSVSSGSTYNITTSTNSNSLYNHIYTLLEGIYHKGHQQGYAEACKRMGTSQLLLNFLRPVLRGRSRKLRTAVGLVVGLGAIAYVLAPVDPKTRS
jgi:hypothetical protein